MLLSMTLDYLAGLVDGEGHLSLARGDARFNPTWRQARLRITMTTPSPLRAAHETFGGRFYGPYVKRTEPGTKPYYIWIVARRAELLPLLHALEPRLYVKREEAQTMIAYIESAERNKKRGRSARALGIA